MINFLKPLVLWLFKILFKVRVEGIEHYHAAGNRVLIVANHTSLLDGILLYLFLPDDRPTFAINTAISKTWYFKPFLKCVDLFAIDPLNPLSLKSLIKFLKQDKKAIIFPEGQITKTGTLMKIYEGTGMVAAKSSAMVLPVGIEGAQYSKLSYMKGLLKQSWFPRIRIIIHPAVDFSQFNQSSAEHRGEAPQQLVNIMLDLAYKNYDTDQTLFQAMLKAMKIHGAKKIVAEDIQHMPITYRQMIMRSFILGKEFSQETLPGENVGVLLPNSLGNLITISGLQCYGRVPAMLNFTVGPQGLTTACETALVKVVYTSRVFIEKGELEDSITALEKVVKVVYLEDLREQISPVKKLSGLIKAYLPETTCKFNSADHIKSDDPAVILFTSGSEGIPKGVVLSHRNILTNYAQIHTFIGLTHNDLILNFLPMFHCFGFTAGTMLPILDGAKVFFYPTPLHYRIIPELCYQLGVTFLFGTNTFLSGYARHAHPADLQTLRCVIAGAEKLQEDTRKIWNDKFGIRILEGYGATETSPVVSVNTPLYNKTGSVGRLMPGMDYYLEPVKGLESGGRLFVSGDNIMNGYLFHGNEGKVMPAQTDRGIGWYDTGDIVTVDELGYITIQGRAKRFAKIGGEMVSLTRVEELANSTWPNSMHAAAVVPDKKKGEQIHLITENPEAERKQILAMAKKEGLSELTVPRKVIHVKTVPILGTGKIDYAGVSEMVKTNNLKQE